MAQSPSPPESETRLHEDFHWTRRQREVLDLIVRGLTNYQIADELGVSLAGAKWHVSEIMSKLGVDTREEAADYWRACNGIPARFSRLFRASVGGGLFRWAAASVAVGGVVAAVVLIAVLDSGDDGAAGAQPDPTAAVTERDPLECPVDESACRAASQQFADLFRNLGIFSAKSIREGLYCPGDAQTQAHLLALCDGVPDGEYREGYRVLEYGSPRTAKPAAALAALLNEFMSHSNASRADSIGTGELRIDSIACPVDDPGCEGHLGVGLTVLPSGRDRLFLLLEFVREPRYSGAGASFVLRFTGLEFGRYTVRTSSAWILSPWLEAEPLATSIPPAGGPCPVQEEHCTLAREVLAAFISQDVEPLIALAKQEPYECRESHPLPPMCQDLAPGTYVDAFLIGGTQSGRSPVPPEAFATYLRDLMARSDGDARIWDAYGTGELQIAAIVCNRAEADPPSARSAKGLQSGSGRLKARPHTSSVSAPCTHPGSRFRATIST